MRLQRQGGEGVDADREEDRARESDATHAKPRRIVCEPSREHAGHQRHGRRKRHNLAERKVGAHGRDDTGRAADVRAEHSGDGEVGAERRARHACRDELEPAVVSRLGGDALVREERVPLLLLAAGSDAQ